VKVTNAIDFFLHDIPAGSPLPQSRHPGRDHGLYFNIESNRAFAVWLHNWAESKHAWMISKRGIAAEIFADWLADPVLASRFWGEVFTESNPDPNDDTRELSSVLKEWTRKVPTCKQEKLRARARKIWERFRRIQQVAPQATLAA
jgi:hypothetical protein